MSHSLLNLDNLRSISRNNESFVREVLHVFQSSTPEDLNQLADHIHAGRGEQVRYLAHKLKSSCFTIGFEQGYELYKALETAAEKQDRSHWQTLFEDVQKVHTQVLSEIHVLLSQPEV